MCSLRQCDDSSAVLDEVRLGRVRVVHPRHKQHAQNVASLCRWGWHSGHFVVRDLSPPGAVPWPHMRAVSCVFSASVGGVREDGEGARCTRTPCFRRPGHPLSFERVELWLRLGQDRVTALHVRPDSTIHDFHGSSSHFLFPARTDHGTPSSCCTNWDALGTASVVTCLVGISHLDTLRAFCTWRLHRSLHTSTAASHSCARAPDQHLNSSNRNPAFS